MNEVSKISRRIQPQEALEALQYHFQHVILRVNTCGHLNGDITVNVNISARADTPGELKCELNMRHCHYGKYQSDTEVRGIEWDEVLTELTHKLNRDNSLKRLTHKPE